MFVNSEAIDRGSWQAFERLVLRLLIHGGFNGVRLVGQTRDGGADLIGQSFGKRWLFQVKHVQSRVGVDVIDRTLEALRTYRAEIPVIVALNGFTNDARAHQRVLLSEGIPLQLWDRAALIGRAEGLSNDPEGAPLEPRPYQEDAVRAIVQAYSEGY